MALNRQPLYLQIATALQREIPSRYPPGTLLDPDELASRFGVSNLTLREALAMLVRQGFIERHKGRGTFVRMDAPLPHVAIVSEMDLFDAGVSFFYRRLVQVLRQYFRARNLAVRLYVGHTLPADPALSLTCDDLPDDLGRGQIRALVAVALNVPPDLRELARRHAIPIVSASSGTDGCLLVDHAGFMRQALDECAASGRRRVALLGNAGLATAEISRLLAERGLQGQPGWMARGPHPSLPGAGWDGFLSAWNASPVKPDALLVADDMLFDDAAAALLSLGVAVPGDVLVITHANRGSRPRYPVPAVRYEMDVEAAGAAMADMALRLLEAPPGSHEQAVLHLARVAPESATPPTGAAAAARAKFQSLGGGPG